ncbi:hypothetical protein PB01_17720 [Psychrobacillus glaciei]|uniref:Uncharacterized protein n=1 Tax=Psychrobacillus glaciei TaxID=2283160 RepID=A0A5J6SR86_9BACI|nr:hypothetical protein [Psychrobacillus glaciei]QFG00492.1 hypothetical protein PB01_17720 [Psychrobacillus glaciei]
MNSIVILTILPFIGILYLAWRINRVMGSSSKRIILTGRFNKRLISSYVIILLLATVVYGFIPATGYRVVSSKDYQGFKEENEVFEQAFRNNEEGKLDSKFLVEEWTQQLEDDTLEIIFRGSYKLNLKVHVEWTDSKEQLVEGKVYRTNIIRYELNMTDKIPMSTIQWEDNHLVITEPQNKEVTFYSFSNELGLLSKEMYLSDYELSWLGGDMYIYLKVPKHMNVIDKDGLQFN